MHPDKLIPTQRAALADAAQGTLTRCAGGHALGEGTVHTPRATNALKRAGLLTNVDEFGRELRITDAGRRALDDAARLDTQAAA